MDAGLVSTFQGEGYEILCARTVTFHNTFVNLNYLGIEEMADDAGRVPEFQLVFQIGDTHSAIMLQCRHNKSLLVR